MSKISSDLPSQLTALHAALERQQHDLRSIANAIDANSIARDLARLQPAVVATSFHADLERVQRTIGASLTKWNPEHLRGIATIRAVFQDIGRIGLGLSETHVAGNYQRIAETLKSPQQQALHTQRLLLRSPTMAALEHIKRTTGIYVRQCYSVLVVVARALATDIQSVAESTGSIPFESPLRQRKASSLIRKNAQASLRGPYAAGSVSDEVQSERKITAFLATLPTYWEPPENPPPKHRTH